MIGKQPILEQLSIQKLRVYPSTIRELNLYKEFIRHTTGEEYSTEDILGGCLNKEFRANKKFRSFLVNPPEAPIEDPTESVSDSDSAAAGSSENSQKHVFS